MRPRDFTVYTQSRDSEEFSAAYYVADASSHRDAAEQRVAVLSQPHTQRAIAVHGREADGRDTIRVFAIRQAAYTLEAL